MRTHEWEPRAATVYCWIGLAFSCTAGSFPVLASDDARDFGYALLGISCGCMAVALALLLVKGRREGV